MKNCAKIVASTLALAIATPVVVSPAMAFQAETELFNKLNAHLLEAGPDKAPNDPGYTETYKELWSRLEKTGTPRDLALFIQYPKPANFDPDAGVPGEEPGVYPVNENGWLDGYRDPETGEFIPAQPSTGEPEPFNFNKYVDAYYGANPDNSVRLSFGAGSKKIDLPQAGYGTHITGDGEKYALRTTDSVTGETYLLTLGARDVFRPGVPIGDLGRFGKKLYGIGSETYFSFGYTKADDTTDVSIPVSGDPVAITYHDFSEFDSTGLYLGSLGLDVRTETELDEVDLILGRRVFRNFGPNTFWGCLHALSYGYTDIDHTAYVSTPTYPDIYSDSRQEIGEHLFAGEAGLFAGGRAGRVSFFMQGSFLAGYRDAELESWQGTTCGACGTGQQYVDITLKDSDSGLTWGSKIQASASVELINSWEFGASYEGRYLADTAAIYNPENGDSLFVDDEPTYLGTEERTDQRLVFTIGKTW